MSEFERSQADCELMQHVGALARAEVESIRSRLSELEQFLDLVEQCRKTQKAYFAEKGDRTVLLQDSKALERQVDAAVKSLRSPPKADLFSGGS